MAFDTQALIEYLPKYKDFSHWTFEEFKSDRSLKFQTTEMQDKDISTFELSNSLFDNIEIAFDNLSKHSSLTYVRQINSIEARKKEIEPFLEFVYKLSGNVFKGILSQDSYTEENQFVWSYTYENGLFKFGIKNCT